MRHSFHFFVYRVVEGYHLEVTYFQNEFHHFHFVGQYQTLAEAYGILQLKLRGTEAELFDI